LGNAVGVAAKDGKKGDLGNSNIWGSKKVTLRRTCYGKLREGQKRQGNSTIPKGDDTVPSRGKFIRRTTEEGSRTAKTKRLGKGRGEVNWVGAERWGGQKASKEKKPWVLGNYQAWEAVPLGQVPGEPEKCRERFRAGNSHKREKRKRTYKKGFNDNGNSRRTRYGPERTTHKTWGGVVSKKKTVSRAKGTERRRGLTFEGDLTDRKTNAGFTVAFGSAR